MVSLSFHLISELIWKASLEDFRVWFCLIIVDFWNVSKGEILYRWFILGEFLLRRFVLWSLLVYYMYFWMVWTLAVWLLRFLFLSLRDVWNCLLSWLKGKLQNWFFLDLQILRCSSLIPPSENLQLYFMPKLLQNNNNVYNNDQKCKATMKVADLVLESVVLDHVGEHDEWICLQQ